MFPRIMPEKIRGMVMNPRKRLKTLDFENMFMNLNGSKLAKDVFLYFKIS